MNWRELWEFLKSNILTIVIVAVVVAAFPWTLIFILPIAIIALPIAMSVWRLRRRFQDVYQDSTNDTQTKSRKSRRGDVTIIQTEQTEQRVNDDVGEYVDFKEIKEKETK